MIEMIEALRLVGIMLDRSAAATETRSPPPCGATACRDLIRVIVTFSASCQESKAKNLTILRGSLL